MLEYKYKESEFLIPVEELVLEGWDGWELVSFTSASEGCLYCDILPCKYVYLFKRKKKTIMNREKYIDKIIALYKLKYNPSPSEIEEFRLILEMMPDANGSNINIPTGQPRRLTPFDPTRPISLMYGAVPPNVFYQGR